MTVYVVETGTQYEGGWTMAVYASRDEALAQCREYAASESAPMVEHCAKDDSISDPEHWQVTDHTANARDLELLLHWGCYYALVKKLEVIGTAADATLATKGTP